mgnify:CR=1 FL=1
MIMQETIKTKLEALAEKMHNKSFDIATSSGLLLTYYESDVQRWIDVR